LSVVKICLSGGLGNQLFQYVFGISLSRSLQVEKVEVFTSRLSRYATARDFELAPFCSSKVSNGQITLISRSDFIINLRLPKIFYRLGLRTLEFTRVSPSIYVVDGYFQMVSSYEVVSMSHLLRVISELKEIPIDHGSTRSELVAAAGRRVVHIRCTDFYSSEEEAVKAVKARLFAEREDCIIVSDDDALVMRCLKDLNAGHGTLRTEGWSAFEMFNLFRTAKSVSTNGSSLAFWGALLGAERFETTNLNHQALFKFMKHGKQPVSSREGDK
jgi:hypothetical protein